MGHQRLGRLPKTRRWTEVVDLLDASPEQTAVIAYRTARAAERRLRALANDPSLIHCFWLLVRLTWAARGRDFVADVGRLGLRADPTGPTIAFIAHVSDVVRPEVSRHPESGPFGELASLALRRTLSETVGQSTPSLFGSTVDELRQAFRDHSTQPRFGTLARRFFGDFLARTLRYFVDKELGNHVGPSHALTDVERAAEFKDALDTHARQTARIMEGFAADWYSRHNWESQGEISGEEAGRFVGQALRKLRDELRHEADRS